jgi:HSP20 family protein
MTEIVPGGARCVQVALPEGWTDHSAGDVARQVYWRTTVEDGRATERWQEIPVKLYRTPDRLVVAAPMPGLRPEDVAVEVTEAGRLILHGDLRGVLKEGIFQVRAADVREGHLPVQGREPVAPRAGWEEEKEVLLDEWDVGAYHRDLELPAGVDGELANVTYGNGVLVVVLPTAASTRPARLMLEKVGPGRGQRVGSAGHPVQPLTTAEHRAAMQHGGGTGVVPPEGESQ